MQDADKDRCVVRVSHADPKGRQRASPVRISHRPGCRKGILSQKWMQMTGAGVLGFAVKGWVWALLDLAMERWVRVCWDWRWRGGCGCVGPGDEEVGAVVLGLAMKGWV